MIESRNSANFPTEANPNGKTNCEIKISEPKESSPIKVKELFYRTV